MAEEKKPVDWERVEHLYRAGLLSIREIASAQGVSHVAIQKRAKRDGWVRDLGARIKAQADSLVTKDTVTREVTTEQAVTERRIVEANAQVIASIRIAHRSDIGRYRRLANKLLEELEGITDEQGTLKELIAQLRDDEEADVDTAVLELANKMTSLPSRTKVMKELGETLKNLIALERQAYDVDTDPGQGSHDNLSDDELDRRIAKLAGVQS